MQVDRHLERVASKAETHLRAASFQEIIVGGPREIVSRFESALAPPYAGASPVASRSRSPTRAPTRSGALRSPCFEAAERRHEHAMLDLLTERLGLGSRAVAGADGVCDMLVQQRVDILLFEDQHEFADPAAIEWMVEEAIAAVRRDPRRSGATRTGWRCPATSLPSCASECERDRRRLGAMYRLRMSDRTIDNYLIDMDGVLVREERLIPGADRFIQALAGCRSPLSPAHQQLPVHAEGSRRAARGERARRCDEGSIWTAALATARFLAEQRPGGSAYVIGEAGLTTALHEVGYVLAERNPDYVVLGETRSYSFERITRGIRLIAAGARFIAANPDTTGPSADGILPATGSVAALISKATGIEPYFVGKPNPLMMREALRVIDAHSESTAMIGDRMDTDVVAGMEAGLRTILVLTGISTRETAERFPVPTVTDRRVGGRSHRLGRLRSLPAYRERSLKRANRLLTS